MIDPCGVFSDFSCLASAVGQDVLGRLMALADGGALLVARANAWLDTAGADAAAVARQAVARWADAGALTLGEGCTDAAILARDDSGSDDTGDSSDDGNSDDGRRATDNDNRRRLALGAVLAVGGPLVALAVEAGLGAVVGRADAVPKTRRAELLTFGGGRVGPDGVSVLISERLLVGGGEGGGEGGAASPAVLETQCCARLCLAIGGDGRFGGGSLALRFAERRWSAAVEEVDRRAMAAVLDGVEAAWP